MWSSTGLLAQTVMPTKVGIHERRARIVSHRLVFIDPGSSPG